MLPVFGIWLSGPLFTTSSSSTVSWTMAIVSNAWFGSSVEHDCGDMRNSVFDVFFCLTLYDLSGVRRTVEPSASDASVRLHRQH